MGNGVHDQNRQEHKPQERPLMPHSGAGNWAWHSPPSKGGFQTPYTVKVQEGGGTEADTGGGKEGQDRGEALKAEAGQKVKATDESAEQRVETRSKPEVELIELKAVAKVESAEQRVETRVKPEVELIGLKAVATVKSAKQRAETRLRPKVELIELLNQKVAQMRQMAVWAELVENMVA